jgi:hypothetical protein
MTQDEFEFYMSTKVSWAEKHCSAIKDAIGHQFPEIHNLSVDMNENGTVFIVFEESIYTQEQVQDYVNELKRTPAK